MSPRLKKYASGYEKCKKKQKIKEDNKVQADNIDDNDYVDVDVDVNDNANDNVDVNDNPNVDVDGNVDFHTFDIFDPRNWVVLDSNMINILALKGPKRFSATYYTKTLPNGEKCDRDWLVYSKKIDNFFLFLL
ncbi:uncharacterized protein LOC111887047 [Lactuca sativa]|uniref:uncharacterized protein LOC111887047 n=1 Tax=Lactuca sativa TaxID=4236 RepID=UPI000CD9258E|nr:uncharacterized protein LOC111887047 [Lactuca sativa]